MGSTYSSEHGGENAAATATATTDAHNQSNSSTTGFSKKEAQHLSTLRGLICREQQIQMMMQQDQKNSANQNNFLSLLWRCSHTLSNSKMVHDAPSSSSMKDIEANLARQSPNQFAIVDKQCKQKMDTFLLVEFPSLNKLNVSLENLFMKSDDQYFLEVVSNIPGMHGHHHQKDLLDFVMNACVNGEAVPARDIIELCFQAACALHYILQEEHDSSMHLKEARDFSSENTIIESMTNSMLEYAKNSRAEDVHYFGGYTDVPGVGVGTAAASSSSSPSTPKEEGSVTRKEFSEWQRKVVPDLMYCSVGKFLHVLFFPSSELWRESQATTKPFPIIRSSKEITSQTTTKMKDGGIIPITSHVFGTNVVNDNNPTTTALLSPPIFAFASISMPKFGKKWYRIFAGADDGWTFQALEHSIMGYEGPTLLVIQGHSKQSNKKSVTFGAYTASKWEKNRRDFFGSSDCFLFQLHPTLTILKPLPKMGTRGGHYMFFHSKTNVNTTNPSRKDDLALGLGFGGTVRHPRLFIDNHLEECHVAHQDTSFEEGYFGLPPPDDPFTSQSFSSTLHIDSLEIYAVGDEDTINRGFKAQYQHRDIADATLRNARTVDKAAFLGDMRNGVIETKAFAHRGQVDCRAHGCLKSDEDGKANGL